VTQPPSGSAASSRPARTIFFGSGEFALPMLEALVGSPAIELVAVIAPPDRPAGRRGSLQPVPIAAAARAMGLPLLQPGRLRTAETASAIEDLRPDLGVLADFGRIVPPSILAIPRRGILNVHPSLLPLHRGAAPVPATILAGDPMAGVVVMAMDEGLDTGPILASRAWPLDGTATGPELEARAAREGAVLLSETLEPYLRGERVAEPQAGVTTLTRPLRREDGRLDPDRRAAELERQVRAYLPWPGSYLETRSGRLAVLRGAVSEQVEGDRPGDLVPDGNGLALVAADGRLRLLEVQPAGGRPMSGAEYRRGHAGVLGQPVGGAA
jgi:methionyl-tRNA formyltransferase